ncbi:MAG: DUF6118 family protein [Rhodospirillales bacterium]|nr:DUF6118 family protein [Rhodospirillales bacterium]
MDARNQTPDEDSAERAFAALRDEVAALRRGIELVYRQQGQAQQAVPDYSPTLGEMAQELRAVGQLLAAIGEHPALRLTPGEITHQVAAGVREAGEDAARGHAAAGSRLEEAVRELRALIGAAQSQVAQQWHMLIAGVGGAVLGFLVWYPLVWLTPWGGGDWLAASLIGGGRWEAGQTLLREADPATWDRIVRLTQACGEQTTEVCAAAIEAKAAKPGTAGQRVRPEQSR